VLEENWWYTAQKFMGEKNFLQGLLEFDKDHIPEPVLRKIRDNFLGDPDFKPSRVEKASVAAKGLCLWVRALDQYAKVANVVAPKRAAAREAERKYKGSLQGLETKQAELREIIL
jgi:dynein heavy chain, axonemal